MPYDSLGTLLLNLGMFGGGLAFGIAGLIIGAVRGITKNSEMWAITFSSFAWLIALMIPNVPWALTIFLMGAIGIFVAFMPILSKMEDTNIFTLAVISAIVNLLIVFGSGAYNIGLNWDNNMDTIQTDISDLLGTGTNAFGTLDDESGLCRPDDPSCSSSAMAGAFSSVVFDVFASVLAIGDYISKAIRFAGMVIFAPFTMNKLIKPLVTNLIIYNLIAVMVSLWNLAILYKIIAFILNKRGMSG